VAVYLYHNPFVPGPPVKEQTVKGGSPVTLGAITVPRPIGAAVAHVSCAEIHVLFNNKTKKGNIFFMDKSF